MNDVNFYTALVIFIQSGTEGRPDISVVVCVFFHHLLLMIVSDHEAFRISVESHLNTVDLYFVRTAVVIRKTASPS